MKRIGIILGVVAIGLAIGGYVFFNGERKPPVRYRTAEVERGPIMSVVSAIGTINPVVSVQVGTQVSGMIKSLHADFNTRVKAGDTVAVIDPEPFRARREQAASNLEMARSSVARARADLAQRKPLLDRQGDPRQGERRLYHLGRHAAGRAPESGSDRCARGAGADPRSGRRKTKLNRQDAKAAKENNVP